MTVRRRWGGVLVLLGLAVGAPRAWAHPIHSTLSVVTSDASGTVLTIRIRAFADDFSAAVARYAGRRAPRDSSVTDGDVARYVGAMLSVTDRRGSALSLESCGVSRSRELYWLCIKVRPSRGVVPVQLRNLMLTELHADQVNIVQALVRGTTKTFLFTKGTPSRPLS